MPTSERRITKPHRKPRMIIDIHNIMQSPSGSLLNPCPICGAKADMHQLPEVFQHHGQWRVICSHSGCRDIFAASESDAVELWNQPKRP